jgi:hypothetical protein
MQRLADDEEEWNATTDPHIIVDSGDDEDPLYVIGLAGSFIAGATENFRFTVNTDGYDNSDWHLTTDFLDVWENRSNITCESLPTLIEDESNP